MRSNLETIGLGLVIASFFASNLEADLFLVGFAIVFFWLARAGKR